MSDARTIHLLSGPPISANDIFRALDYDPLQAMFSHERCPYRNYVDDARLPALRALVTVAEARRNGHDVRLSIGECAAVLGVTEDYANGFAVGFAACDRGESINSDYAAGFSDGEAAKNIVLRRLEPVKR